ncbi:MAG: DUF4358 domain-containing protein [Eubacteriales bacterium]|jgi:hypothetical protein|nr:DUF4358 domain-containing protein [Clostridiales bacterium]
MKNNFYRIVSIIAAAALIIVPTPALSGCDRGGKDNGSDSHAGTSNAGTGSLSAGNNDVDISHELIAEAVFGAVQFTDELESLDGDVALAVYNLDGMVDEADMFAYAGTGALAEELVIVRCVDNADEAINVLQEYRDKQKSVFESYNAGEVVKLNDAVIMKIGGYVVYCVSPDSDAVKNELLLLTK